MGIDQTLASERIQLGSNKNIFNEPKMPSQKCSSSLDWSWTSAKILHIFLGQLGVSELNHIVFAFGHLNPINYIKCPNNHKLKCLLLEIFQTVATVSCMIFGNALAFLINPNTIT